MIGAKTCRKCGLTFEGARCKPCFVIYKAEYYQKNKAAIKSRNAERGEDYQRKARERAKKWFGENKARALARNKTYYESNRDGILAKQADYRRSNAARISERMRLYYGENRQRLLARSMHYGRLRPRLIPSFYLAQLMGLHVKDCDEDLLGLKRENYELKKITKQLSDAINDVNKGEDDDIAN